MTTKHKILTISTYPFDEPAHGGQHRVANIVKSFRDAGYEVQSIGVLGSEAYPPQAHFEPFPGVPALQTVLTNAFLMEDYAIGKLFAEKDEYFQALARHVEGIPDAIHIEQPWLFEFARLLVSRSLWKKTRLIYGSANIEAPLKREILSMYLDAEAVKIGSALVDEVERDAVKKADCVVAVSESDGSWALTNGAKSVLVARNGVVERDVTENGLREANTHSGNKKFALYCASAHPPNMAGFFHYFGNGAGSLAPSERMVIAGGAGPNIVNDQKFHATGSLTRTCVSAGLVSEECLAGLLETAHVIILPLEHGGGTNLKTAEALWAGKHIVGTPTAFRGFEHFADSEGVRIAAQPKDFLAALREAMAAPPLSLSEADKDRRRSVLWESTLGELPRHVSSLLSANNPSHRISN